MKLPWLLAPAVALALGGTLASPAAAAPARYYVVVRGVDEADGVKSGIVDEARALFTAEIKKHPEFTLDPPTGLKGDESPQALRTALQARHMRALELTLRILSVSQQLTPPPAGKLYRVLVRGIKLSVFGDTLPDKVIAIGGDGDAQIGAEIGKETDAAKEGKSILLDATKEAVKQAVDMTLTKLNHDGKPLRLHKKKG